MLPIRNNEYKLSHYLVFTDPVNINNDRIIYSTTNEKLILVSDITYTCLVNGLFSDIPLNIFKYLLERNVVVFFDKDELVNVVFENMKGINENDTLYEVIMPSGMCQLDCNYCGQSHENKKLNKFEIHYIIERIKTKLEKGNFKKLEIAWFGGEPMLALQAMKTLTNEIKELTQELGITYESKIVTNGYKLNFKLYKELVEDFHVRKIDITLDGISEFHDKKRFTKKGLSSFHTIFNNLKDVVSNENFDDYECRIVIRCNVDKENERGVMPLMELLAEEGILMKRNISFNAVPIYSWGGNDAHNNMLEKQEFARKKILWILDSWDKGIEPKVFLPKRKKEVCMSVKRESEVIDASGRIYNCTEIPYSGLYDLNEFVLGNIQNSKKEVRSRYYSDWNNELLNNSYQCSSCKLLPICGGSCPKSWKEGMNACPTFKYNIKELVHLYYIINKHANKSTTSFSNEISAYTELIIEKNFEAY